ncbi:DUF1232 domain-containing protein [Paenibacillus tarimensis]|uniref:DUF1232 domain-containing protein n=1 Tax=Paenibacillus tarimensis TaxID=416012 RepID=UPI001F37F626|nr:DUF1232 domain-containing protein [Paenibacillus tarimensis]MCF2943463.1 DUF1232 domain-containing protein [Paenibacillus tarimensis]
MAEQPIDNKLGTILKDLLNERSLSIRKLDQLTGIDAATISRIINGKRKATPAHLQRLAECLDVPVSRLFAAAGYPASSGQSELNSSIANIEEVLQSTHSYDQNFSMGSMQEKLSQYEQFSLTDEGRQTILQKFIGKLQEVGSSGPFIQQLKEMYDRFRLKRGTALELAIIGSALIYFILPTDCIPDFVFPIGYIDDAVAVNFVFNTRLVRPRENKD